FLASRSLAAVWIEDCSPVSSALTWVCSWPRRVCTYLPTVEAATMASRDRTQTPGVVAVSVKLAACALAAGAAAGLAAGAAGLAGTLAWAKAREASPRAAIAATLAMMRGRVFIIGT